MQRGEIDVKNSLLFLCTNHPMCQIVTLSGMEEKGGQGGFLYAEEKKGIVCPYLSVLFLGYSILAAESRGRLRQ